MEGFYILMEGFYVLLEGFDVLPEDSKKKTEQEI